MVVNEGGKTQAGSCYSNPIREKEGQNWDTDGGRVERECGSEISETLASGGTGEKKSQVSQEDSCTTHGTGTWEE